MTNSKITGFPSSLNQAASLSFELRFKTLYAELCEASGVEIPAVTVSSATSANRVTGTRNQVSDPDDKIADHHSEKVNGYRSTKPKGTFERLVLQDATKNEIIAALSQMQFENRVFDDWGLREIEPAPRTAINFHGAPGTGKTFAAHAAASYLGKEICAVSYADVESKYHGDGPKNIDAVFAAAERAESVLFFDEADSLLSRRLTNVSQGSEQAINSMRSQLLICLERHRGVVIFATNLVENYDAAFNTRVRHIAFSMPDRVCRQRIWESHLPNLLPLANDVDCSALADSFENVCGREIKNAVVAAAVGAAVRGDSLVRHEDFRQAIQNLISSRVEPASKSTIRAVNPSEFGNFVPAIKSAINSATETASGES
jgi:SpoVK/Ycf46/Vps4 family AAA+-type ATPase